MRPNNQYTSPENRFFLPLNHAVEHHESFITTNVPQLRPLAGRDHYVHVQEADGTEYATELHFNDHDIPPGARILGVKGFPSTDEKALEHEPVIDADNFGVFGESCGYAPATYHDTMVVVRIGRSNFLRDAIANDPRFSPQGIAIFPADQPLPAILGVREDKTHYRFLGYIDPEDVFIDGSEENSLNAEVIDWCVINAVARNDVERLLLRAVQPRGEHLISSVESQLGPGAYLKYYDAKYGTSFYPKFVPRDERDAELYPQLTTEELRFYKRSIEAALFYMNKSRDQKLKASRG